LQTGAGDTNDGKKIKKGKKQVKMRIEEPEKRRRKSSRISRGTLAEWKREKK